MMKIYIINLPRSRERLESIRAECARFGLEPEVFPAVDGRELTPSEIKDLLFRPGSNRLTPPEIGCALSHLAIYRDMARENIPHALILEDDSVFRCDPRPVLAALAELPATARAVHLLTQRRNKYYECERRQVGDVLFYRGHRAAGGNGYVITQAAAAAILAFQTPLLKCPCDWWTLFQRHGVIEFYIPADEIVGLHPDFGSAAASLIEEAREGRRAATRGNYFQLLRRAVPLGLPLRSFLYTMRRVASLRRQPPPPPVRRPTVSAVMITLNEEEILPHSLAHLQWADEIIVVDSNSTDNTREIAAAQGAKVFVRAFKDFSDQINWAIAQATGDWVLIVDADELMTPDLEESIRRTVGRSPAEDIFALRIDTQLFGRMMRASSWSNLWKIRLFRRGVANFTGAVHQNPSIGKRRVGRLDGVLLHYTCRSTEKFFEKQQLYSTLWARKYRDAGRRTSIPKALAASVWRLFHNYFVRGEIRDGSVGFACSILAGAHTFTRHMKLWGLQNAERFDYIPKAKADCADGGDKAESLFL